MNTKVPVISCHTLFSTHVTCLTLFIVSLYGSLTLFFPICTSVTAFATFPRVGVFFCPALHPFTTTLMRTVSCCVFSILVCFKQLSTVVAGNLYTATAALSATILCCVSSIRINVKRLTTPFTRNCYHVLESLCCRVCVVHARWVRIVIFCVVVLRKCVDKPLHRCHCRL
jgi:hypothetical protein